MLMSAPFPRWSCFIKAPVIWMMLVTLSASLLPFIPHSLTASDLVKMFEVLWKSFVFIGLGVGFKTTLRPYYLLLLLFPFHASKVIKHLRWGGTMETLTCSENVFEWDWVEWDLQVYLNFSFFPSSSKILPRKCFGSCIRHSATPFPSENRRVSVSHISKGIV